MSKTVIIADDHPVFLLGLRMILKELPENYKVLNEAYNPDQLLELLEKNTPDILITDLSMPETLCPGGIRMIKFIRDRWPTLQVVVITMINEPSIINMLSHYRVKAILSKNSLSTELKKGLFCHSGLNKTYMSNDFQITPTEQLTHLLTKKELAVLELLGQGLTVSEIAEKLYRTKQTISSQKQSLMRKLKIQSDSALYNYLQKACISS